MASRTLASVAAEIATEEVLCLEAACAAAEAAAFLPLFLPPAMPQLKRLQLSHAVPRSGEPGSDCFPGLIEHSRRPDMRQMPFDIAECLYEPHYLRRLLPCVPPVFM